MNNPWSNATKSTRQHLADAKRGTGTEDYQTGFNQAANDYEKRRSVDVSRRSEDYQEGYQAGWEHNATLNPSQDKPKVCDKCLDGYFRPCHFCGAS